MKAIITNVITDTTINTTYVTYSTGTEKVYPADKLPKTVQAWVEKNAQKEPEVEEPEGPEVVRDITGVSYEVIPNDNGTYDLVRLDGESAGGVSTATQEDIDLYREYWKDDEPTDPQDPEPEPTPEPHQTHTEPRRATPRKQVKTLSLDIVEGLVSALLMFSRVSLMALACLLTGMAVAIRAGVDAHEWLTPRTAALIEQATAAYHTTVRPACKAALVWTAEAVWYILI